MADFIKGLDLCEQFFFEIAKPLLDEFYPSLKYTAGLIGYGSDVLGYDDIISTDHMWGPRFYLFLDNVDAGIKPKIEKVFAQNLPYIYKGFSVNFSKPDMNGGGIRHTEFIDSGEVSPLIFIKTIDEFLEEYIGTCSLEAIGCLDWLSFSEHRLLALTSGRVFIDRIGVKNKLDAIKFYPDDVMLYLIASQWSLIAEEQAFVKRCGQCSDELGAMIICARIAERLMRLCFLYNRKYAPYSKWFGTAFGNLPVDENIKRRIYLALSANDLMERENHLIAAQANVAQLHNKSGLTSPVEVNIQSYFGRDINVIFADGIASTIAEKLKDTPFENIPLIGTLSQVGNFTAISDNAKYSRQIKGLYAK